MMPLLLVFRTTLRCPCRPSRWPAGALQSLVSSAANPKAMSRACARFHTARVTAARKEERCPPAHSTPRDVVKRGSFRNPGTDVREGGS